MRNNNIKFARILIENGADINIKNNEGLSAIDFMSEKTDRNIRILLSTIVSKQTLGRKLVDKLYNELHISEVPTLQQLSYKAYKNFGNTKKNKYFKVIEPSLILWEEDEKRKSDLRERIRGRRIAKSVSVKSRKGYQKPRGKSRGGKRTRRR
jgi:hypothetical protein